MHLNLYLEMVALVPWQLIDHHQFRDNFTIGFIPTSMHNEPFFAIETVPISNPYILFTHKMLIPQDFRV